MADSNITKKALAAALKELLNEMPFEKINVAHICDKCGMNRKSFYYHFKDKYDLINWIFDTEFITWMNSHTMQDGWDFLRALCYYFYENRSFYRKALKIHGQNSFSEHFREMLEPLIREYLSESVHDTSLLDFNVQFLTDGFICAFERWILDKNCLPPQEFLSLMESCINMLADRVYTRNHQN